MQKVKLFVLLFITFLVSASFNIDKKKNGLWQSWSDIQASMKLQPRPILIDMYADWCMYCKQMDRTTYKNDSVYTFLKEHFYCLKFNAESKNEFDWNNKKFPFDNKNRLNEFFEYVAKGNLILPTTVIITPDNQPYTAAGMLYVKDMELMLKYYSTEYPRVSFADFSNQYKTSWK
ncbi:MAG: thioredoxin family protein [Bacteroidota bacterium]|nr:thioredoxin family protein [Bacteroidota bacterium]